MRSFWLIVVALCLTHPLYSQSVPSVGKGDFEWKIIGRILFDGGIFFSDKTELGNSVEVNDARLGFTMNILENWRGKIEVGFAKSQVSLKDAYLEYYNKQHLVRVGHAFEPFALGYRIGTSDMKFNGQPATAKVFGDRRKIGISYTYNTDPWNISAGIFSDKDIDNQWKGDEGYAFAGRLLFRPCVKDDAVLHLGASTRFSVHGEDENRVITYSGGAPSDLVSEKFLKADVDQAINQWKFGAELIGVYDKFFFQGEYMRGYVNRKADVKNYFGEGGYVEMGYVLLNGRYGYNQLAGMVKAPGAKSLELLFRYNMTDLNNKEAGIMGGKQNDLSLGSIYYFNAYIAAKISYSWVDLDKYAAGGEQSFSMIQGRIQLSF